MKMFRIGVIMLSVRDVIRSENDAPISMPTAMASMLPFRANSLKSFRKFFIIIMLL